MPIRCTTALFETRVLSLNSSSPLFCSPCRMYDVDGNGVIDQEEMTKIVQAIYDMLGAGATRPTDSAEERAKNIFSR